MMLFIIKTEIIIMQFSFKVFPSNFQPVEIVFREKFHYI